MTDRVYKLIEIVGTTPHGTDEAIRNAIEKTSKTVENLDWFQVVETRGQIADGKIAHFQVVLKVGFRVED